MAHPDLVRRFLAQGFSFPCSCCEKLHRALGRGMGACEAAVAGQECGGPVAGMSFPLYEGPLSQEALATHCLFCGEPAVRQVSSARQPLRLLGICQRHLPTIDRLAVAGRATP